ncbi:Zn-finger protein [Globisporangium polare]
MESSPPHQQLSGGADSEPTAATTTSTNSSSAPTPPASRATADTEHTTRVLSVGDGNFSYSLAYAKRFVAHAGSAGGPADVELTATSYDSYDELVDKYPESARICAQIRELGAKVLHRVDATNLQASLENARALPVATDGNWDNRGFAAGKPEREALSPFDVIIFNHPHCGEENVKRHKSLLSHFYASALEILSEKKGNAEIHLTLAKGQPERWEAVKRAHMAGLTLKQQIEDVDSHERYGLEYERKRHQNGKSFHRVLLHGEKLQQQSTLFIFTRQGAGHNDEPTAFKSAVTPTTTETPSRKRKAQDMATQQQQPLEFACDACEKSFKTTQGLKTHVHMVHELGQGSSTSVKSPAALPCGFCERTFKNEDAQRQHRLAKHGEDQLIHPDWYQKQQATGGEAASVTVPSSEKAGQQQQQQLTCSICQLTYPTQSAFDAHWQDLRPKEVVLRNCTHCGRAFDEERALRQHQNFCKAQVPDDKQ